MEKLHFYFPLFLHFYIDIYMNQQFNSKRILNLVIQTIEYSALTYAMICFIKPKYFNKNDLKIAIFPIAYHKYWFISAYVVFYLFTPFLNTLLKQLDKKKFISFIAIQLLLWSIIPMMSFNEIKSYLQTLEQFLLVYFLGAFLRINYNEPHTIRRNKTFEILFFGGDNYVCVAPHII